MQPTNEIDHQSREELLKRTIPVIDLRYGRAVHAVGGARRQYRRLDEVFGVDSDPERVAAHFAERFPQVYFADLDAILDDHRDWELYRRIVKLARECWFDLGIGSSDSAITAYEEVFCDQQLGALIIGLESLESIEELREICASIPREHLVFSLDLSDGEPMARPSTGKSRTPIEWAKIAIDCGMSRLILLELTNVGNSTGPPVLDLCRELAPLGAKLYSGGGTRDLRDVSAALAAGCSGILVGTALHDGRIS